MSFPTTRQSLLSRARKGDDDAWSQFVLAYTAPALGFLQREFKFSETDAQDLWQELVLKLKQGSLQDYQASEGKFRSWLAAALRHRFQNWRKHAWALKRDARQTVSGNAPVSPDDPDGVTLFDQLAAEVQESYEARRRKVQARLDELLEDYPDKRERKGQQPGEKEIYLEAFWDDEDLTEEELAGRHRISRDQLRYLCQKVEAHLRKRWDRED